MKQLILIGNGFDINLGMKTAYQDFYDYYKDIDKKDPDIIAIKKSIESGRYTNWSDLEKGLGDYSKMVSDSEVFLKCLRDIKNELSRFLTIQYNNRNFESSYRRIKDDIDKPEKHLDEQIANNYLRFLKDYSSPREGAGSSIVSFNYTKTLEEILTTNAGLAIPILHAHGFLDDIVMGVNDAEQIANESFRSNRDVTEEFIKPDYNNASLNDRNNSFTSLISEANIFVLFGLSLGETDRKWWRLIGKRLLQHGRPSAVLYFPYDIKKDTRLHPNYRLRWTEEYQKFLLSILEIPEEQKEDVMNRMFIGINKDIFKLPIKRVNNKALQTD